MPPADTEVVMTSVRYLPAQAQRLANTNTVATINNFLRSSNAPMAEESVSVPTPKPRLRLLPDPVDRDRGARLRVVLGWNSQPKPKPTRSCRLLPTPPPPPNSAWCQPGSSSENRENDRQGARHANSGDTRAPATHRQVGRRSNVPYSRYATTRSACANKKEADEHFELRTAMNNEYQRHGHERR